MKRPLGPWPITTPSSQLALPLVVARRRHRQPRRFGGKVTDAYVRRALLVVATACAHVMETVARVGARGDEAAG